MTSQYAHDLDVVLQFPLSNGKTSVFGTQVEKMALHQHHDTNPFPPLTVSTLLRCAAWLCSRKKKKKIKMSNLSFTNVAFYLSDIISFLFLQNGQARQNSD